MDTPQYLPRLLQTTELVVQQTSTFMSNDFEILDTNGQILARVQTTGGIGSRLLMGNRTFDLVDDFGNLLLTIKDPVDLGLDRYELFNPDGSLLANVTKQFSYHKKRMRIELPGLTLNMKGSLLERSFTIQIGDHVAATITRQWAGLHAGIKGRSRYSVSIDTQAPEQVRLGIIGGLVALDLLRAKESNK